MARKTHRQIADSPSFTLVSEACWRRLHRLEATSLAGGDFTGRKCSGWSRLAAVLSRPKVSPDPIETEPAPPIFPEKGPKTRTGETDFTKTRVFW